MTRALEHLLFATSVSEEPFAGNCLVLPLPFVDEQVDNMLVLFELTEDDENLIGGCLNARN